MAIKTIRLSTPTKRAAAVRVLETAYERIEAGHENYVCSAVRSAGYDTFNSFTAQTLREKISKALGRHGYVTDWLIEARRLNRKHVIENQRQYRLLWIKEMIAQNKD